MILSEKSANGLGKEKILRNTHPMKIRSALFPGLALFVIAILIPTQISQQALALSPVLPDSSATPGATNPAVNQGNIQRTICVSGYTSTIRPSSSYTTGLKKLQLKTNPYSAYGSTNTTLFEEDHLIPLELGGDPRSIRNLWPEPWTGESGAHIKDQLENKLHALVCSNSLNLSTAQRAIATNWYAAYQLYVLGISPLTPSQSPAAPVPTISPSSASINFSMPFFLQTIGSIKSNWSSYGFINPPAIAQDRPGAASLTCKPASDTDQVIQQFPSYNSPVNSLTLVTLITWCIPELKATGQTTQNVSPPPTSVLPPSPPNPLTTSAPPIPISIPIQSTSPQPLPTSTATQPAGATGKCNDGTFSFAAHHQGMCSGHGGVAQFYT